MELSKRWVLGLELVSKIENTVKLIWEHLKAASNWKKSYADLKRKEMEYDVGE